MPCSRSFLLAMKEALLGLSNGMLVGVSTALAMYAQASLSGNSAALFLAAVVFVAMAGACVISGDIGVIVPPGLRRFGADPVTASTILTDITSMGLALNKLVLL